MGALAFLVALAAFPWTCDAVCWKMGTANSATFGSCDAICNGGVARGVCDREALVLLKTATEADWLAAFSAAGVDCPDGVSFDASDACDDGRLNSGPDK